jgi:hypothetical protein
VVAEGDRIWQTGEFWDPSTARMLPAVSALFSESLLSSSSQPRSHDGLAVSEIELSPLSPSSQSLTSSALSPLSPTSAIPSSSFSTSSDPHPHPNPPLQSWTWFRVECDPSLELVQLVFGSDSEAASTNILRRPPSMFEQYARILRRMNALMMTVGVLLAILLRLLSLFLPVFFGATCSGLPSFNTTFSISSPSSVPLPSSSSSSSLSSSSSWLLAHELIAFSAALLLPMSCLSAPAFLLFLDVFVHAFVFAVHAETHRQISALHPKLRCEKFTIFPDFETRLYSFA